VVTNKDNTPCACSGKKKCDEAIQLSREEDSACHPYAFILAERGETYHIASLRNLKNIPIFKDLETLKLNWKNPVDNSGMFQLHHPHYT